MTIHSLLTEITQMCALSGFEIIQVTASDLTTVVQSHDADKTLFVKSDLVPFRDVSGVFGIMNLKMLSGLLKLKPDETVVKPHTRQVGDDKLIDQFEFRNGRMKSSFRLMAPAHIPKQPDIKNIPWTLRLDDIEMFSDFPTFAALYSEVDKFFSITVEDSELICTFGQDAGAMQSGSLIIGKVDGAINTVLTFPIDKFIMMLKLAKGRNSRLMFTDKGLLGMEIETSLGVHNYYLRQVVR